MHDETGCSGGPPAGSADERAQAMRRRKEEVVLETLRAKAAGIDLADAAASLGGRYDAEDQTLHLFLLDREVWLDRRLEAHTEEGPADYEDTAILLNALLRPGGRSGEGWRAFRELAGGHAGDFREEAEAPLGELADEIAEGAEEVASAVSGRLVAPVAGSDATFEVPVFPNVRVLVQVFREDMEFPAEGRILFSEGADRFLPPGCLEELGIRVSRRIRAAAQH